MDLSNITLMNLLPPTMAKDRNVMRAVEGFDSELRNALAKIPNIEFMTNIKSITDSFLLDILAWQFHVELYDSDLTIEWRRKLVANSIDWHFRKGTVGLLEDIMRQIVPDAVIEEWWEFNGAPYTMRLLSYTMAGYEKELFDVVLTMKNVRSLFLGV